MKKRKLTKCFVPLKDNWTTTLKNIQLVYLIVFFMESSNKDFSSHSSGHIYCRLLNTVFFKTDMYEWALAPLFQCI